LVIIAETAAQHQIIPSTLSFQQQVGHG